MVAIGIGLFAVQPLYAADSVQLADFKVRLSDVSPIDLPLSASTLVSEASEKSRESVTADAVRAAISTKSTVAPSIVGAIAHTTPSMAVRAALTAASMERKQLREIVKAATAAAPSEAGKVVAALIRAYPAKAAEIAIAAGKGAPAFGREILAAVGSVSPTLQPVIKKVLDSEGSDAVVSVQAALSESAMIASQLPSVSKSSAASVLPVTGAPSAPFEIILNLTTDQITWLDTETGQSGNSLSDPSFIQDFFHSVIQNQEPVVTIGSPGR